MVVLYPRRESNVRIGNTVKRLLPERQRVRITESLLKKEVELVVCILFVRGETGWWRAGRERLVDLRWHSRGHIRGNAEQFRRRLESHLLRDGIAPVAALRDKMRVAEALHEGGPCTGDARRIPTRRRWLA